MQPDIEALRSRNARVEAEKAWEMSWTRRGFILLSTFLTAFAYMKFGLGIEAAALHAAVPAGGYFLSTLSLSRIRTFWLQRIYRQQNGQTENAG